ncbi:AC118414.1 [Phodopus roborovskii]|uniref:AC118414.1 protein n=1 Tax=Phodopus roborovskii TaxID=109678 RepID=A0AAU9Z959_PHORO|nr:AC118414.1 [Phodopus roborovskii]
MKVICLIEISSCLVKHTEVTQKYISELPELKKSKDYVQPDKTYFCISYILPRLLCSNCYINHLQEMQGSFCLETQNTLKHTVFTKKILQIHYL